MICFGRRVALSWLAGRGDKQWAGVFWGVAFRQTFIGVFTRVEP